MTSPRIAWVIKGLARGGAERLVTTMAPRIRDLGYDIEVLFVTRSANGFVPVLHDAGIPVRCVGRSRGSDPRWLIDLAQTLRTEHYDLIHTHSPLPGAICRVVAPRETAMVHTEHNMWGAYRLPTRLANVATLARNRRVYAVSDGVSTSMQMPWWGRRHGSPIPEVLLHGVDPDVALRGDRARQEARLLLGLHPEAPVVGHVANLSPKKDQATLLAAFEQVRASIPDAQLVVVGDGPLRTELEQVAADRGIEAAVHFLGSRDDVTHLLPGFDVFALSSVYEGLPIALLEAMAAEVACVSTAVGGIPEAARHGIEAELVSPADADALADVLGTLLQDERRRRSFATAGRTRVEAAFSIDRAVETICRDYRTVLAGAHR